MLVNSHRISRPPNYGSIVGVNWRNPLTRGLRFATTGWVDAVSGAIASGVTGTPTLTEEGWDESGSTGSEYISWPLATLAPLAAGSDPFTLVFRVYLRASGFQQFGSIPTYDTTGNFVFVANDHGSYRPIAMGSATAGGFAHIRPNTGAGHPINQWVTWAVTYNGEGAGSSGNFDCYLNGESVGVTTAGNYGVYDYTVLNIGGQANPCDHVMDYLMWFARELTIGEIRELYARPYQVFHRSSWLIAGAGTGAQFISPSAIASAEAFGSTTITVGGVTISPGGIASAEAFGSHTILTGVTISPGGIASAEAFGSHTINVGGVTIIPSGIVSGEAFGSHVVASGVILIPSGIASGEAFGTAAIIPGGVTLLPPGIVSGEQFGNLIVLGGTAEGVADTILQLWRFRKR